MSRSTLIFWGLALSVSVLFLQVGFTYYLSYQTFAMILVMAIVWKGRPVLLNSGLIVLSMIAFTIFLAWTGYMVPIAISENSENLFVTSLGVIGYALIILSGSNVVFRSPALVLRLYAFVSAATILAIAALIVIADLGFVPFLTRETLIQQNTGLITNFISQEVLDDSFAFLAANDLRPNIDLFYGEQSFLAAVLFACVTCRIICARIFASTLEYQARWAPAKTRGGLSSFLRNHAQTLIIASALGAMIYIESFSSFFYALVVCASLLLSGKRGVLRLKISWASLAIMTLALVFVVQVALFASDYYTHRVSTVSESLSFDQRFSIFFDFGLEEYLLGVGDPSNMPRAGFQNGISYVIGIAGMAGISLLVFIVYRVYWQARPLNLALLGVACVLGIFSQNGAIFSPNKVVILSLVLLPLACVDRKKRAQPLSRPASYSHV